jgi:hypothetical protein
MARFLAALFTMVVLTILAGCAGPRPFSFEEKLWHDTESGVEFNGIETLGHRRGHR